MTYVVTENCIRCKHTDCVEVCPVDAFHEGPNFLAINPDECIDCHVCVDACPVNAIVADDDDYPNLQEWIDLNARLSKNWPVITVKKEAMVSAESWKDVPNKRDMLEE